MCALLGGGDFTEGGRCDGVEGGRWAGSSWVGVASSLVRSMSSSNRDIPKISPLAMALMRKREAMEARLMEKQPRSSQGVNLGLLNPGRMLSPLNYWHPWHWSRGYEFF